MTAQQCLSHPWLLGEGEISDPITMGDMIANFSNMQSLVRITKTILLLKYLLQNKDATVKIKVHQTTRHKEETERDDRDHVTAGGSYRRCDSFEYESSDNNLSVSE
jgi:hypothetical protein